MSEQRTIIRTATVDDHKRLCAIAKGHRAGSGFSHFMFSGPVMYAKGWLRVVERDGEVIAFTCVRHKVRQPKTMLYYIIVDASVRSSGLGTMLLEDLMQQSPHRTIELSCLKDNDSALRFYAKHGFLQHGEALKGKGWHLEKTW